MTRLLQIYCCISRWKFSKMASIRRLCVEEYTIYTYMQWRLLTELDKLLSFWWRHPVLFRPFFTNTWTAQYRVSVNVSALKIHISENARIAIAAFPEFITEFRGDICVKVKAQLFHAENHVFIALSVPFCRESNAKVVLSWHSLTLWLPYAKISATFLGPSIIDVLRPIWNVPERKKILSFHEHRSLWRTWTNIDTEIPGTKNTLSFIVMSCFPSAFVCYCHFCFLRPALTVTLSLVAFLLLHLFAYRWLFAFFACRSTNMSKVGPKSKCQFISHACTNDDYCKNLTV